MRYIKPAPMRNRKDEPFKLTRITRDNPNSEPDVQVTEDASNVQVLAMLLDNYNPDPAKSRVLSTRDARILTRVIDRLEGEPKSNGCYLLEDEEVRLIRQVMDWVLPIFSWRNAGHIADWFDNLPTEEPIEDTE